MAAAEGGSITAFEKACDEMLAAYLGGARTDAFSEKVLISHICTVENELTSVRIILTGMMAGMAPDTIRERLRGLNV